MFKSIISCPRHSHNENLFPHLPLLERIEHKHEKPVNRKNQTDIVSALTKKSTEIKTTVHRICPSINGTLMSLSQARTRQKRPYTITNCPEQQKQQHQPEEKKRTTNGKRENLVFLPLQLPFLGFLRQKRKEKRKDMSTN